MKSSSVYLMAAERVEKSLYMCPCIAIECADGDSYDYANLFSPHSNPRWYEEWGTVWGDTNEEIKACRVLALCFMAAIVDYEAKHGR